MPHIWTNILFSEDVMDTVAKPFTNSEYEAYLKLGAQGPDPFYYYGITPWANKDSVHEVGKTLHENNNGALLTEFIKQAKNSCNEVKAFVSGFVTHFVLFRYTFPFIHVFAKQHNMSRRELAIIIDTLLIDRMSNLKSWKTPVYKELDIGRKIHEDIVQLLQNTIRKHYPELETLADNQIHKSYRDMLFILKCIQDPYGIKKFFFGSLLSSYSHQPIHQEKDYLNLNYNSWSHPITSDTLTKSFIELYGDARMESIDMMTEVQSYWNSDETYSTKKLEAMIQLTSFQIRSAKEKSGNYKYHEPIW